MNGDGCVTLEEILAAAAARAAALVPETAGYLALAIADATSRLPLAYDERGLLLSTEGSASALRRGEVVSAKDGARALRDVLARLLAVSAGTMPGLAAAARAREESTRGVDGVVEEIEAALIPVNRAAARRALARLARETLKAKEQERLRPRAARPRPAAPSAVEEPARGMQPEARRAAPVTQQAPIAPIAAPTTGSIAAASMARAFGAAPAQSAQPIAMAQVAIAMPAPAARAVAMDPPRPSVVAAEDDGAFEVEAAPAPLDEQDAANWDRSAWADELQDPTPTEIGMVQFEEAPAEESPAGGPTTSLEVKTGYGTWTLPTPPPLGIAEVLGERVEAEAKAIELDVELPSPEQFAAIFTRTPLGPPVRLEPVPVVAIEVRVVEAVVEVKEATPEPAAVAVEEAAPEAIAIEATEATPESEAVEAKEATPEPVAIEVQGTTPAPLAVEAPEVAPEPIAIEAPEATPEPIAIEASEAAPAPIAIEAQDEEPQAPIEAQRIVEVSGPAEEQDAPPAPIAMQVEAPTEVVVEEAAAPCVDEAPALADAAPEPQQEAPLPSPAAEAVVEAPAPPATPIEAVARAESPAPDASVTPAPALDDPEPLSPIEAALRAAARGFSAPEAPPAAWTRADDLLSRFAAPTNEDASIRQVATSLKRFAGLDPTPPPPAVRPETAPPPRVQAAPAPPIASEIPEIEVEPASEPSAPLKRARFWTAILLGAIAGVVATAQLRPYLVNAITAKPAPAADSAAP